MSPVEIVLIVLAVLVALVVLRWVAVILFMLLALGLELLVDALADRARRKALRARR
jgi:hypothetical protein